MIGYEKVFQLPFSEAPEWPTPGAYAHGKRFDNVNDALAYIDKIGKGDTILVMPSVDGNEEQDER